MRIAITGATGFIGQHVVREALAQGHQVLAITRSTKHPLPANNTHLTVAHTDLAQTTILASHLESCDAVIHLAAVLQGHNQHQQTLDTTRSLLNAMTQAKVKRLTLVSSISVLDYGSQKPLSTIDEDLPVCAEDDDLGSYARMKRDQEKLCNEWTIIGKELLTIRPGLVYSDDILSDAHAGFIKKGLGVTANHEGTVPLVDVKQVAKQIILATSNTLFIHEVFHLVGKPPVSQGDYLQQLKLHGKIRFCIPLPWQCYSVLTACVRQCLRLIKKQHKVPDGFRKNSVAARQKPFYFSTAKADDLLN
jgi:nucleoside-diphosphate-sugar epimerase